MTRTFHDYTWLEERVPSLMDAYCLTLVQGLSPAELLRRFGAAGREQSITGTDWIIEAAYWTVHEHRGEANLVAATAVGDWALALEPNGFLGCHPDRVPVLSAGTTLVAHCGDVNAHSMFVWAQDGEVRLGFDPLFPEEEHWGSAVGQQRDQMRGVGFDLDADEDEDGSADHCTEAAFALAERITGVQVTLELLEATPFRCAVAPLRHP